MGGGVVGLMVSRTLLRRTGDWLKGLVFACRRGGGRRRGRGQVLGSGDELMLLQSLMVLGKKLWFQWFQ